MMRSIGVVIVIFFLLALFALEAFAGFLIKVFMEFEDD